MGGFEALELAHEVVILGVGDGGFVEYVVEVLVVADLVAEGVDFVLDVGHLNHGKMAPGPTVSRRRSRYGVGPGNPVPN